MRVYVASHCRWAGLHVASVLDGFGHHVNSNWLLEPFNSTDRYSDLDKIRISKMDYWDIHEADALVLIAGPDRYPGGKFVEAGIAIGLGKRVVVIGRRENMLLYHPAVHQVETPLDAANLLINP